jgi:poly(3-hydroxybutyrate) depolymerase
VVFNFHHAKQMTQVPAPTLPPMTGGLAELPAVKAGAIYVAPQGTPFTKERTIGWYASCPGDDVDFFDAMLAAIGDSHCIDPRAVLVTGFSWGAEMALALACCRGDRIRLVAPASGVNLHDMPRCPARALPALRVTYAENDDAFRPAELAGAVTFFRRAHRCEEASDPVEPPPCVSYRGCDAPVVECRYRSIGHQVAPGFAEETWKLFSDLIARDPR